MISKIENLVKKYLSIVRILLTICLFISTSFYTAFRVAQWLNSNILVFLATKYNQFELIKLKIIIPLLVLIELLDLFYRFIKKDKNIIKDILVFILFFIACALLYKYSSYNRFIDFAIIIYFSRYVKYKSFIITYVLIYTASLLAIIYGNLSGNLSIYADGRGCAFGTIHSNSAGLFLFMYFLALSYLFKNNKKIVTVFALIVEYILYKYIQSRTPFITTALFIVLLWSEKIYLNLNNIFKKIINYCFILLPIILLVLSFCIGYLLCNSKINMDASASARFYEFIYATKEYGFSLGYRDLSESTLLWHYYFDNGYGQLLFRYGLVSFGIMNIGWLLSNIAIIKNKNYHLAIMCTCLYIYNLMEFILFFNDLPLIVIAYMTKLLCKNYDAENM